jgi:hypothetical protein
MAIPEAKKKEIRENVINGKKISVKLRGLLKKPLK